MKKKSWFPAREFYYLAGRSWAFRWRRRRRCCACQAELQREALFALGPWVMLHFAAIVLEASATRR